MKRWKIATAVGGIVFGLAASVLTSGQVATAGTVSSAAAAPGAMLYAVVDATGSLARGTSGTTTSHVGTGRYNVTFARSVRGCQVVANLGYTGTTEDYRLPEVATVVLLSDSHTIGVEMTFPGPTSAGTYPHAAALADNAFHLAVNCHVEPGANVSAAGVGVGGTASRVGVGRYVVDFGQNVAGCSPIATVKGTAARAANALQPHLAAGPSGSSVLVQVSDSDRIPVDAAFSVVEVCSFPHVNVASSNGFSNQLFVGNTTRCALLGNWFEASSTSPQIEGYVSTWATSGTAAVAQTKNGGYGVQSGYGLSFAALCG